MITPFLGSFLYNPTSGATGPSGPTGATGAGGGSNLLSTTNNISLIGTGAHPLFVNATGASGAAIVTSAIVRVTGGTGATGAPSFGLGSIANVNNISPAAVATNFLGAPGATDSTFVINVNGVSSPVATGATAYLNVTATGLSPGFVFPVSVDLLGYIA